MEASVRVLHSSNLNRHLLCRHYLRFTPKLHSPSHINSSRNLQNPHRAIALFANDRDNLLAGNRHHCILDRFSSFAPSQSSAYSPHSSPLGFLLSLSESLPSSPRVSDERFDRAVSDPNDELVVWQRAPGSVDGGDLGLCRERGPVFTVVLLGWLGAKQKHLKRYVDLYTSRGIHAVTVVVPVRYGVGLDSGRRIEKQISALGGELVSWLSETEEDGRERYLLFHTFSNTGWLVYGAILDFLQSSGDYFEKIKGCVIDSGGDPEINPKVWAAGFSAALLKKRSSSAYPSVDDIHRSGSEHEVSFSNMREKESSVIEATLLFLLEKLFYVVHKFPDINQKLTKIVSILSHNQPPCPQFYLYSTADKVIPFQSVELFVERQNSLGRKVWSYNFVTSPHVDHYRSFPHIYTAEIHKFLEECVTKVTLMYSQ